MTLALSTSEVKAERELRVPLSPAAMSLWGRIGYHDSEGVTVVPDEQSRIVANLAAHLALIFRNHGTLTVGRSVGEAFNRMYLLERACQIQVAARSSARLAIPPAKAVSLVYEQPGAIADIAARTGEALRRCLDRRDTRFRD